MPKTYEDQRAMHVSIAASIVEDALRRLYVACDGDEAEVGEIMHELHQAARARAEREL